jgi:5-formyltetrahydrofolate cyclo-ligase
LKFFSYRSKIKKDKYICSRILDIIQFHDAKNILVYIPLSLEVDIHPLIKILRKQKVNVYVPYIQGKSFIPVPYRLPLKKGKMNIKESGFSRKKVNLDMVVVPIIGIDSTYRRIGFGAGMYDRFFENLQKKPITLFVQRKLCYSKDIITASHDIKPDYIITM